MDSVWNPALRPNSSTDYRQDVEGSAEEESFRIPDTNRVSDNAAQELLSERLEAAHAVSSSLDGIQGVDDQILRNGPDEGRDSPPERKGFVKDAAGLREISPHSVPLVTSNIHSDIDDAPNEMPNECRKSAESEGLSKGAPDPAVDTPAACASSLENSQLPGAEDGLRAEIDRAFEDKFRHEEQSTSNELNRTNSFPEIPPLSQSPVIHPHPLPRSQAEYVVEGYENHERQQAPQGISSSNRDAISGWDNDFALIDGDDDAGFFAASGIKEDQDLISTQSFQEKIDQARFEEGLPLVTHNDSRRQSWDSETLRNNMGTGNEQDGHSDFFDKPNQTDGDNFEFENKPLDRKSTMQVLDSLHYEPREGNQTFPADHGDVYSLPDPTKGGIAISTETAQSRTLAEQSAEDRVAKPRDDDLADMWKAALGEDDLLEENGASLDSSMFFEDDGEGFLEDDVPTDDQKETSSLSTTSRAPQLSYSLKGEMPGFSEPNKRSSKSSNAYIPAAIPSQQPRPNSSYYPTQPVVASGLVHSSSMPNGFPSSQQQTPSAGLPAPPRPQLQAAAQSFADKSKGGYTSPYDLPMDVTRPRKRPALPTVSVNPESQQSSGRPPQPRSSSMYPGALPSQDIQPPQPSLPKPGSAAAVKGPLSSELKTTGSSGSFFEDLPSTKPRPSSSMGKAIAPLTQSTTPPPSAPQGFPTKPVLYEQQRTMNPPSSAQDYQLLPPERLSLFGDAPSQQMIRQSIPVMSSRYSPAPSQSSTVPPPSHRYASSPAAAPRPPSIHALPHQPRTSSPLTQKTTAAYQQQEADASYSPSIKRPALSGQQAPRSTEVLPPRFPSLQPHQTYSGGDQHLNPVDENMPSQYRLLTSETPTSFPPQASSLSSSPSASSHTKYTPGPDYSNPDEHTPPQGYHLEESNGLIRGPPRRSQTQSPSARKSHDIPSAPIPPYQRPASVNNYTPSLSARDAPASSVPVQRPGGGNSQPINYIKPVDGRELDSLERWKGCPIVSFGFGGTIVKMFPQQIPRYASGQKFPLIKCSPGEVKIENGKTFALDESIATFPGPLKAKGRKKDVLDWLQKKVHDMESSGPDAMARGRTLPDRLRCHEERILLWKVMKVLVEYDGIIEGNAASEQAVRAILSPELNQGDAALLPHTSFNAPLVGIIRRDHSSSRPDSVRSEALEELRKKLLHGDREQAVWHAVDNRLWAHAMLLSSTLDQAIWKQVSQEFVRQEVKTFGGNTESLAALYQIFAGNLAESVDELVPPSARAGLQMVSKSAGTGPTKNALDGLDRWRETLTLILSNRTTDDGKALVALGQLLASYGRTEAAHICYIFAKTPGLFGGPDDPQVSVALLGADHIRQPFDYGRDFDSILLTEVHDFARTILASSSASTVSPHLQSYKLYHAMILAEYGYKSEAQQYCDTILSTLKSTTKPSPYYHGLLAGAIETLQDRLRQAPRDGTGSWISRPSIDKVSGSIWAKFNSYVAGDEDDTASTGSSRLQEAAAGPFARVAGDSPTLSRTPSSNDLYNAHSNNVGRAPTLVNAAGNSRYAPGVYTPRSSLEQQRHSTQDVRGPSNDELSRPSLAPQQYSSRPVSSAGSNYEAYSSQPKESSYAPRTQTYLPTPPSQPDHVSEDTATEDPTSYPYQQYKPTSTQDPIVALEQRQPTFDLTSPSTTHQPTNSPYEAPVSYEPPSSTTEHLTPSYMPMNGSYEPSSSYQAQAPEYEPSSSYGPPGSSYEPPSSGGYEPPSYSLSSYDDDARQTESSPIETRPKKSVMDLDDDEDFGAQAAALRKEEKARKDKEADEAFRKAAEADAQKDKVPKLNSKKSWFGGGWFGGKDKANESGPPNAPIKVKLGEENSFYFDEQLKKWVNKKGGTPEAAAPTAPPPPKGPPSRAVSAAAGPPPSSTPVPPVPPLPMGMGAGMPAMRAVSGPTSSPHLDSNQPSRTGSPAVSAMPTGDGTPPATSSTPPSRPATSQSGASNMDDLIGIPQARKGGTMRKGKKGRGYVDVMAK